MHRTAPHTQPARTVGRPRAALPAALQVAARVVHYLAYHVSMGVSGLLLYTDAVQRHYLRRVPALQPYLRGGQLRCGTGAAP